MDMAAPAPKYTRFAVNVHASFCLVAVNLTQIVMYDLM